jgi:hypothetical protein
VRQNGGDGDETAFQKSEVGLQKSQTASRKSEVPLRFEERCLCNGDTQIRNTTGERTPFFAVHVTGGCENLLRFFAFRMFICIFAT